jgi:hypothetical protein
MQTVDAVRMTALKILGNVTVQNPVCIHLLANSTSLKSMLFTCRGLNVTCADCTRLHAVGNVKCASKWLRLEYIINLI